MSSNKPAPNSDDDYDPDEFEKSKVPTFSKKYSSSSSRSSSSKDIKTIVIPRQESKPSSLGDFKTRIMPSNVDRQDSKVSSSTKDSKTKPTPSDADRSPTQASSSKDSKTRLMPSNADRLSLKAASSSKDFKTRLMPSRADRQQSQASSSKEFKTRLMPLSDSPFQDLVLEPQKDYHKMPPISEHRESKSKYNAHSRRGHNSAGHSPKAETSSKLWKRLTDPISNSDGGKDPFYDSDLIRAIPRADKDQSQNKTRHMPKADRSRDFLQDSNRIPDRTRLMPNADRNQSRNQGQTRLMPKADRHRTSEPPPPRAPSPPKPSRQPVIPDKLKTFFATSRAPQSSVSMHRTYEDQNFAARQTEIESLPPQERKQQDQWVQRQLDQLSNTCPMTYEFRRIQGGYICKGGSHLVTDELLAEGKRGLMILPIALNSNPITGINIYYSGCFGPYYPDPEYERFGVWRYFGDEPIPSDASYYMSGRALTEATDPALVQLRAHLSLVNLQKEIQGHQMGI